MLQLTAPMAELVKDEIAAPRLKVLPEAEQSLALTLIGELAHLRQLSADARRRLEGAKAATADLGTLREEADAAATVYLRTAEEGRAAIALIEKSIADAMEKKAQAERRRVNAEVDLERRGHLVLAIDGEIAKFSAAERERAARLTGLLAEPAAKAK